MRPPAAIRAAKHSVNEEITMATALKSDIDLNAFVKKVSAMASAQFDSPQYKRLLSTPLTVARAQRYTLQKAFWNINRRDCWALAQGIAPMDIKKLVWAHEEDELSGNKARGVADHYSLQVKQSELIGLSPDDFKNEKISGETRTVIHAWLHLCKHSPWQKSLAACMALEVSNSTEWVPAGGMSYRMGKKYEKDLGIPFDKQINAKEHAEVDVDHGHMLVQIMEMYGSEPCTLDLIMEGLVESWEIERVWKGLLADMMAEVPVTQ
jgi:hypothetical protein